MDYVEVVHVHHLERDDVVFRARALVIRNFAGRRIGKQANGRRKLVEEKTCYPLSGASLNLTPAAQRFLRFVRYWDFGCRKRVGQPCHSAVKATHCVRVSLVRTG